jgi:Family of unknown function (DUF6325)
MSDQALDGIDELGPIDYLVIEFPGGRMTGEGLPLLLDLVDRRIVRVFDLVFVKKSEDGTVRAVEIGELDSDGSRGLAIFDGAGSGLLRDEDVQEAGGALEPGSAAAILVYENLWAAPLAVALRKGGAQLVAAGRIPVQALIAALDAAEASSSSDAVEVGASQDASTVGKR